MSLIVLLAPHSHHYRKPLLHIVTHASVLSNYHHSHGDSKCISAHGLGSKHWELVPEYCTEEDSGATARMHFASVKRTSRFIIEVCFRHRWREQGDTCHAFAVDGLNCDAVMPLRATAGVGRCLPLYWASTMLILLNSGIWGEGKERNRSVSSLLCHHLPLLCRFAFGSNPTVFYLLF